MAMQPVTLVPVGRVVGGRVEPADDGWGAVEAEIVLDATTYGPDDLAGLEAFSHLEVVYWFHHPAAATPITGLRHPRGRADWPAVGVFAQRAKNRPNRLGVSVCRLLGVDGLRVRVEGLDAIDGTPVLDIKPYSAGFAPRGPVVEPEWAEALMDGYW